MNGARAAHPAVYLVLIIPFGVLSGFDMHLTKPVSYDQLALALGASRGCNGDESDLLPGKPERAPEGQYQQQAALIERHSKPDNPAPKAFQTDLRYQFDGGFCGSSPRGRHATRPV